MSIVFECHLSVAEYSKIEKFQKPTSFTCPCCKNSNVHLIHCHGTYSRCIGDGGYWYDIRIQRLLCLKCRKTTSLLPSFLLPYFRHSLSELLLILHNFLYQKKSSISRQLRSFLTNRFFDSLNWIRIFFAKRRIIIPILSDKIKSAKKHLKVVTEFGHSTFLLESHNHLSKYFLAK